MPFLYLSGWLWETEPAQELASAETFAFASTRSGLKITAARISPLFPAVCRHCGVRPDKTTQPDRPCVPHLLSVSLANRIRSSCFAIALSLPFGATIMFLAGDR